MSRGLLSIAVGHDFAPGEEPSLAQLALWAIKDFLASPFAAPVIGLWLALISLLLLRRLLRGRRQRSAVVVREAPTRREELRRLRESRQSLATIPGPTVEGEVLDPDGRPIRRRLAGECEMEDLNPAASPVVPTGLAPGRPPATA